MPSTKKIVSYVGRLILLLICLSHFLLIWSTHTFGAVAQETFAAIEYNQDYHPQFNDSRRFIDEHIDDIRLACFKHENGIVTIENKKVFCIRGFISDENQPDVKERAYDIAYASSPGGVRDTAIKIGLEMHKNKADFIVDGICYSSCANYLVPAARSLYIVEGTVIGIHGTLERSIAYYTRWLSIRAKKKKGRKLNQDEFLKLFIEANKTFKEWVKEFIIPEVLFFAEIGIEEAYLTRYVEVVRTLAKNKQSPCYPTGIVNLILGPKHLKEFHVNVIHGWFPNTRADYVGLNGAITDDEVFIFDFDEHPFLMPGIGLIEEGYCDFLPGD